MIGANYIARRRKTEDSPGERHSEKRRIGRTGVGIVGILATENHHAMGDAPVILCYGNMLFLYFFWMGFALNPVFLAYSLMILPSKF